MKVRELIELLSACDPESEVWADGCDCVNPVDGVEVLGWDNNRVDITVSLR